eukprot:s2429_g16.t1
MQKLLKSKRMAAETEIQIKTSQDPQIAVQDTSTAPKSEDIAKRFGDESADCKAAELRRAPNCFCGWSSKDGFLLPGFLRIASREAGAEKPRSREAEKPRSREAEKPRSHKASREAEKPRSHRRSREAEKPRSREAEKPPDKPRSREGIKSATPSDQYVDWDFNFTTFLRKKSNAPPPPANRTVSQRRSGSAASQRRSGLAPTASQRRSCWAAPQRQQRPSVTGRTTASQRQQRRSVTGRATASQRRSVAASQRLSVEASQRRSVATSQHCSVAASTAPSQRRSVAASRRQPQRGSVAASQRRSATCPQERRSATAETQVSATFAPPLKNSLRQQNYSSKTGFDAKAKKKYDFEAVFKKRFSRVPKQDSQEQISKNKFPSKVSKNRLEAGFPLNRFRSKVSFPSKVTSQERICKQGVQGFTRKMISAKIEKFCRKITFATLMQQLQYNLRRPVAKDNRTTLAEAAPSNLDAAGPMHKVHKVALRLANYQCTASTAKQKSHLEASFARSR